MPLVQNFGSVTVHADAVTWPIAGFNNLQERFFPDYAVQGFSKSSCILVVRSSGRWISVCIGLKIAEQFKNL